LKNFTLIWITIEVLFLECFLSEGTNKIELNQTKVGHNSEMFWMETKPTRSDRGKSQNIVNALKVG
jgi:hypothetical protein